MRIMLIFTLLSITGCVSSDTGTLEGVQIKFYKCCNESVTETAYLGGKATIICNYPEELENYTKYFCNEGTDMKPCYYIISPDSSSTTATNGRFSVIDNIKERSYTVTISDLTKDDTKTYWCGVKHINITLFTKVQLVVTATTTAPPTTSFNSSSTPSPTSPSPTSPSLVTIMGATVIIMVCVNVVVLLIVMILNIVYRRKYNKTTGVSSVNMEKTDNGINREHCHGDGDYDEINNGPPQSDTDCTTTTSPSDSIYYASVNFHKDAEFPNEATAAISKEETSSSDYATVNVGQSSTDSTVNHPCSSSEAPPIYSIVNKSKETCNADDK